MCNWVALQPVNLPHEGASSERERHGRTLPSQEQLEPGVPGSTPKGRPCQLAQAPDRVRGQKSRDACDGQSAAPRLKEVGKNPGDEHEQEGQSHQLKAL